ncbi:carbohydrate ABC transporter permease [Diaminobutyricibacter sp. McL0618]|uniref:carbohydrate ABC transporter permease n=1 Tax=Leifsonia sp. McL0618 TaxID=3415677 RepID=UPI003CF172FE
MTQQLVNTTSATHSTPRRAANKGARRPFRRIGVNAVFVGPGVILLGVMSLYPIFILVRMSLSSVDISNIVGDWPFVGLQNFADLFASTTFQSVVVQTLFFVAFVLVATMFAGLIVALALRPSRGFPLVTQTALILVWTLPPVIVGQLWKFLLSSQGALNQALLALGLVDRPIPFLAQPSTALAAVAAVTVWVGVPFAALVIKSAMLDVSVEILDAAKVDGANKVQVLTRIIIPMIRPTLLILAVLTIVAAFKAFDLIYTMTKGGPGTSSSTIPYLGYITAFPGYQFGHAAAISVVAMIIVVGLAIAYIAAVRREEK